MRDYYLDLEVDKNATEADIKKSYRSLAIKYHPDKNQGDKKAEEKFKVVATAYEILGNSVKRKEYDSKRGYTHKATSSSEPNRKDFDMDDLFKSPGFNEFFGKAGNIFKDKFGDRVKGPDTEITIAITLEEMYLRKDIKITTRRSAHCGFCSGEGGSGKVRCQTCNGRGKLDKTLNSITGASKIAVNCTNCNGEGKIVTNFCTYCSGAGLIEQDHTFKFKAPAYFEDEAFSKQEGFGNYKKGVQIPGDLKVNFTIAEHKLFDRKGRDIELVHEVGILTAIEGGEIKVPTLDGTATIKIDKNSAGKKYRLGKKGLDGGAMIVIIDVFVPRLEDLDFFDIEHARKLSSKFNP